MGNFFAKLLPSPTLPTDQADRAPDQQPDQAPQIDTISEDAEDEGTQPDSVSGDAEDQAVQRDAVSEGIEEGKAAYQPGGFHPVYIGDIFNDRYKVLNKIGYGQYSTVWLVKDLQAR